MTDLIDIQNLEIAFGGGQVRAVRGVSFSLDRKSSGSSVNRDRESRPSAARS